MRIAMVVPDLSPSSGGPAWNVPALAEALVKDGVVVDLHTLGSIPVTSSSGVGYRVTLPAVPRRLGRSPDMRRNLLSSHVDLVHAHCLWMYPLEYAAKAAHANHMPLVISPRGMLAPWALTRSPLKKAVAARLIHPTAFRVASAWHATSNQEESDIRAYGMRQPVFTVPNGVHRPPEEDIGVAYYRRQAPELAGRRVLLFYSRFHAKKRVLELIADFAGLASRHPQWHLLVVGIAEQFSIERLREEAAQAGVAERTTVLDGLNAPKPYGVAELMALPTFDENFGQVVAEALAAGLPVITTTRTPWAILNELPAGRWVPIDQFTRELEGLLAMEPGELAAAGTRGREWILANLEWSAVARRMREAYAAIIAEGKTSPQ
jgi:glycosyltransferase involved in cell wall biosynthesis